MQYNFVLKVVFCVKSNQFYFQYLINHKSRIILLSRKGGAQHVVFLNMTLVFILVYIICISFSLSCLLKCNYIPASIILFVSPFLVWIMSCSLPNDNITLSLWLKCCISERKQGSTEKRQSDSIHHYKYQIYSFNLENGFWLII